MSVMEMSSSLLLNEEALAQCSDQTKPIFIYEWLRYLDRILPVTQKADIKNIQKQLVKQLTERMASVPGAPTRQLLARCLAKVFTMADAYDLFQTINSCNDSLKAKDDSAANLPGKLTALSVLGALYEDLGRIVGRSYEEAFQLMVKWLKSAESSSRTEILLTLSKMVHGLGSGAYTIHKDLYKQLTKSYLTDRVMPVRAAAATCLFDLISEPGSPVFANGLDAISTQCLKALEGSNYEVRLIIAKVYAKMAASTVDTKQQSSQQQSQNKMSTVEFLEKCLGEDFLFGRVGGFLKSSSSVASSGGHKEIRVGLAYAYIEVVRELGTSWLEKNLALFIKHVVKLAEKCGPLAYTNNPAQAAEVVHMRRCISFIFRQTLGEMLSEPNQLTACKLLGDLSEYTAKYDTNDVEEEFAIDADAQKSAQATMVSLLEISALVRQIGTAVTPLFMEATGIMEPINVCLKHPVVGTRVAAAWCLRCVTHSVPPQRTVLIERYIKRLTNESNGKGTPEGVHGIALALAALVAGANDCELGIPFGKSKQVFLIAEDMIKTATQTCKLALQKIKSGWLLISAVITMGTPFVRDNLSRLLLLWKYAFPRSLDEAKSEKGRGDAFTWECSLESRAGALASMANFMIHCPDLADNDVIPKIVQPIETSLATMALVADLVFTHGAKLRQPIYTFRIRLYSLLSKVKLKHVEHQCPAILRELVADFSLSDNVQSTAVASITSRLCTSMDSVFLAGWVRNTTQARLEEELYASHLPIDKTIENDPLLLVNSSIVETTDWPEPLPVNIASIDSAILMFGSVYSMASSRQKLQMTNHFLNTFKASKNVVRQQSIHLNILSAVLCAMKSMGELKNRLQGEELQKANMDLIIPFLNSDRVLLRCVAIETLGQLSQVVGERQFVAGNVTLCSEKLNVNRDEKSKTGFVLSLGALHKYVGSLGSEQHFSRCIQDIFSLTRDGVSPSVQAWSILSLSLIATNGSGMFINNVEPSLGLALKMLMNTASTNVEVILCVGKLISALITLVGPGLTRPELQMSVGNMDSIRSSFLTACAMMFEHSDPYVKAEALACWQQLHVFAPRFVQLDQLVTKICNLLYNPHLVLRKAAVSLLRQLLQREVKEVREHAQSLIPCGMMDHEKMDKCPLPENGLEGALFEMLDVENDLELRQNIKESLNFLVQATSGELLSHWLAMCKDILASSDTSRSTIVIESSTKDKSPQDDDDAVDDEDTFQVSNGLPDKTRDKVTPRWPTRIFAFDIVQKLMGVCDTERAHLDFALAKELQTSTAGRPDYLVLHLPDLIKMSFIGATSDSTSLRLAGLACLQDVINRFATVPDPSFPGDVILKQFQAQVGAALRPAFGSDTPSHVTAAACQVCSTWIGSGVAKDLNDLRRVHQLLTDSLDKCKKVSMSSQLYNESTVTLEKLAILKAWAEVYIGAVKEQDDLARRSKGEEDCEESLLNLVDPQLDELVGRWMSVLRDSALLALPVEFASQLPEKGGTFYTPESAESCKDYYRSSWAPILLATSIWLNKNDFDVPPVPSPPGLDGREEHNKIWLGDSQETRFQMLLGMCCEALCSNRTYTDMDKTIQLCLNTLKNLTQCKWAQLELMRDVRVAVEMLNILHRQVLTRDNLLTQHLCADVVLAILEAARVAIATVNEDDVLNGNVDGKTAVYKGYPGGEGINGFDSNSSLSFATLEIALCLLVRQIPQINSALMKSKSSAPLHFRKYARLPSEGCELVKLGVKLLIQVPKLCSQEGAIVVLPTVFYLVLGVLRESSRIDPSNGDCSTGHVTNGAAAAMVGLKDLVSQPPSDPSTFESWSSVVRSSLLSLLNMVEGESLVDEAVVMLAATVMATTLPSHFPIGAPLFHKYCRLLKNCLNHQVPAIQQKALQSINSVFAKKEISAPYVRELGPLVFDKIRPYVLPEAEAKSPTVETDLPLLTDLSEAEAVVIQETIKTIESVLKMSTMHEKEVLFVNLILRCLGRFLCNDPATELPLLPAHVRKLHEFAFQRINALAPGHPEAFKTVVQACPAIKQRIEKAAQLVSRTSQTTQQAIQQKLASMQQETKEDKKPKIELKMDFAANFATN